MSYLNGYHEELAENGLTLTPTDIKRIEAMQDAEIAAWRSAYTRQAATSRLDRLNAALPAFQSVAHGISGALMVSLQTLIAAFGVLFILACVVIVEIDRVRYGVALFDPHQPLLGAIVVVLMNVVLEFVVFYVEHRAGYKHQIAYEFSLRGVLKRLAYIVGIDSTPRPKSPAHAFKSFGKLLTVGILVIALMGSMQTIISTSKGSWYEALQSIVTQSSLQDFSVWLSGLLFAFLTVIGTQRYTSYVARRASEVIATNPHDDSEAIAQIRHTVAENYARAKIARVTDENVTESTPVPRDSKQGRRNVYTSNADRQRAYRNRQNS